MTARMLTRAAVGPAISTQTGWAAELAQVSLAFLQVLAPMSAGASALARSLRVQFGNAATILIPGVTSGQAKWVAEGAAIPAVKFLLNGPTMQPFKLASISALTMEMLQNENAEAFVRQALIDSTAPALDAALFSNAAADTTHPAGILNGVTPLTASLRLPINSTRWPMISARWFPRSVPMQAMATSPSWQRRRSTCG
jgi:hypothetical protein